jgi:hypothetical protein
LLSLLTTSCIPTTPGGNPTPQNDTTVVYTEFSDSIAQIVFYSNSPDNEETKLIDLDANGTSDINLTWYIGVGFATCKIAPINTCSIITKNLQYSATDFFNLNDNISSANYIISSSFYTTGPENGISITGGSFSYTDRLLGFTLNKPDGIHYGWMKVSYSATFPPPFGGFVSAPSSVIFKINSMAYKKAPDTPIQAGVY